MTYTFVFLRTIGAVILGVALVKLLSLLCTMIRRQLQQAPWRVEVVSDDETRVRPIDVQGVCNRVVVCLLKCCLPVEILKYM